MDKELYPNQSQGGPLDQWQTQNKSGDNSMFTDIRYEAGTHEGQVCLNITFDVNCYFMTEEGQPITARLIQTGEHIWIYADISISMLYQAMRL